MNNFTMPPSFPDESFKQFGKSASLLFPGILSDENFDDPNQRQQHFSRAFQAVMYRYRACSESNQEFISLVDDASELWKEWTDDEEHNYKIEKAVYQFFMAGLSVFESYGFCLYFVGNTLAPPLFPHINKLKCINLHATSKSFAQAFPAASITQLLTKLLERPEFKKVGSLRNIFAHRVTGRRNIRGYSKYIDGMHTETREEVWSVTGSNETLIFDRNLVQRQFDDITGLLTALIAAALEFINEQVWNVPSGQG